MRSLYPLAIVILFLPAWTIAQRNTPKYSNEFLNIGVDARAFGMGLSTVAHVHDVSAGYWNPAGLLDMEPAHQLSLMHSPWFGGLAGYDYAAFATGVDDSSRIGFSVLRFSVDDIADTRFLIDDSGAINYDNIRFFSASDYAFLISYARRLRYLGGLKAAGNVKVIHRVVGQFARSWGFGVDIGVQKAFGEWKLGLMGKDLFGTFNTWSHNEAEVADIYEQTGNEVPLNTIEVTLPRAVIGIARDFALSEMFNLLATADLAVTFDGRRNTLIRTRILSVDPYGGLEVGFKRTAFLRAGVSQFQQIKDFDGNLSWSFQPGMGIGLKLKELSIDYAFTDIGDLAAGLYAHIFSVKVDFNVEKE